MASVSHLLLPPTSICLSTAPLCSAGFCIAWLWQQSPFTYIHSELLTHPHTPPHTHIQYIVCLLSLVKQRAAVLCSLPWFLTAGKCCHLSTSPNSPFKEADSGSANALRSPTLKTSMLHFLAFIFSWRVVLIHYSSAANIKLSSDTPGQIDNN